VFIFIWECTRFLPNEIYSVSVKYIFDYKVKFLRYTRTYSLNGRGRRGIIIINFLFIHFLNSLNDLVSFRFSVYIFCFVSFLSLQNLLRFILIRFLVFRFVSFRFVSVSFLTLQGSEINSSRNYTDLFHG
jgi:hypothetical protein